MGLQINSNVKYTAGDPANVNINQGELVFGIMNGTAKIAGRVDANNGPGTIITAGISEAAMTRIVEEVIQEEVTNILNTPV